MTEARDDKPSKRIPIDADPDNIGYPKVVDGGNLLILGPPNPDGSPTVRYVPKTAGRHITHFATCDNPSKWRKSR